MNGLNFRRARKAAPRCGFLLLSLLVLAACSDNSVEFFDPPQLAASNTFTLSSSGIERDFYVRLPTNYDPNGDPMPLLIALHGAGDSIDGWFEGGFQGDGLQRITENEAIMVIPNARVAGAGRRIWDPGTETDYIFFEDLMAWLGDRVVFDDRRVFVTGHSAGGLMAHEWGCRFGDVIRGIAPSAGSITSSTSPMCVGSTAVMQIQGEFDSIQPLAVVTGTRDLWAQYNGFDLAVTTAGANPTCEDYSLGASAYPMQWCLHQTPEFDGHAWWPEADETIWNYFSGLPLVEPTMEPPAGGGNEQVQFSFSASITATIEFPDTLGEIFRSGIFLYPEGSELPVVGAPVWIVNGEVDLGCGNSRNPAYLYDTGYFSAARAPARQFCIGPGGLCGGWLDSYPHAWYRSQREVRCDHQRHHHTHQYSGCAGIGARAGSVLMS